jgi:D-arabinose 1-dehydrogenase-like Zn-dependent alcohol dehydrogenase
VTAVPGTESPSIGELPPVGNVPKRMWAQVIRQDRFGDPQTAFRVEEVDVPLARDQVLVAVMAAGINFNNVWAARGLPIDVIRVRQKAGEPWDFHIGGSDASGVVYAVGEAVRDVGVGDQVVIHHGWWDADDPWVAAGKDPMLAPSARIWGYETNFGSFGQFTVAQAGTTGYSAVVDLRYHWVRQKRLQGSHGTNDEQARAYNDLVVSGVVGPCLGKLYGFEEIPDAHDEMERGVDVFGNRVALVGAPEPGLGRK